MSGPDSMLRREKAGEKAKKVQKKLELIEYRVEGDDILILSGQHKGKTVRSLWPLGPVERDYITKHLWLRNDEKLNLILNSLCCK